MELSCQVGINAGSLSLPVLKVNIVDICGRLSSFSETLQSVVIYPGTFESEVRQMLQFLFPDVRCTDDKVGEKRRSEL